MALRRVLIDEQREARAIRRERRFVRRTLVKSLRDFVEIRQIVVRAINPEKGVERFAAHRRVFRHAEPKLFRFRRQIPFRSEPRQIDFAIGLLGGRALG
jgi:hypothetical protein